MKLALSQLVIWPRDESKEPRVVTFAETGINLVAGGSRSGKSAIIKIIDYCLGSSSCSIPKLGPIRRSSAWYGISLITEEGYKLLARRDPGEQESTDDYMLIESASRTTPERPVKNTNRDAVKGLLARLARLPQVDTDFTQTGSGYRARASFGDMTAFLFQPQSIVANESILFYKTEEEEHAHKLRAIFPLVLGAVDADTLVRQHRLAEVRRLLEKRRRQLDALRGSATDYAGELRGRFLSAVDLGLVQADVSSVDEADLNTLLSRLRDIASQWLDGPPIEAPAAPTSGNAATAARLAFVRHRETEGAARLASLKLRLLQLRELSQARQLSENTLARERDRLSGASWLTDALTESPPCPFCGSENHAASRELGLVLERVAGIEAQWQGIGRVPPMLDAEEVEVQRALTVEAEGIRQFRSEREQLERLSTATRRIHDAQALFVGRLSEFLTTQRSLSSDAGLAREIEEFEREEEQLRALVDSSTIEQRKEDALLLISHYAQQYGKIVQLEDNDAVIKLDTKELTIRVLNERGESAWLWQVGSGANHLGYHVATLLALHEFFIQRQIPYVPHLLALDQPSQTQFPDDMDEDAEAEELLAVHKAFEAFDSAVDRTEGRLQVIVSEHASKTVSQGIKHLTVVERWRRGRKLIPWHWDTDALLDLNGTRADFALEDLRSTVLFPALARMFTVDDPSLIEMTVAKATFDGPRIVFELEVLVRVRPSAQPPAEGYASRRVLHGSVAQDLTVSIESLRAEGGV